MGGMKNHLIKVLEAPVSKLEARRAAVSRPTELARVDDHAEITWVGFNKRVEDCAAALQALGLKPGERIGNLDRRRLQEQLLYSRRPAAPPAVLK
jgi:acyl-CoA synthetase (AMP-forming)/AMP-acid ligase II